MTLDPAYRRLIASFRKSRNWDSEMDLYLLQKLWPALVGEGLAKTTTVVALHGSRVVLNVPDQIWRRQLIRMTPQLLARLNEPWGTRRITDIAFTYET
jgi:predicted nucleic acid-binding Zn ribbon protein